MPEQRAHFTEPARQPARSGLSVKIDSNAGVRSAATYGPSSGSPTSQQQPSQQPSQLHFIEAINTEEEEEEEGETEEAMRQAYQTDDNTTGCVPTHRSVFRLLRRKLQTHRRTGSSVSHEHALGIRAAASAAANVGMTPSSSTSSASFDGGYMRSRKPNRAITLSAQRTRSEFAVAGPPPLTTAKSDQGGLARNPRQLPALDGSSRQNVAQTHPRALRADKGTIVQLRSTPSTKKIVIPAIDDLHAEIAGSMAASAPAGAHSPSLDDADADVEEIDTDGDADASTDHVSTAPTPGKPAIPVSLSEPRLQRFMRTPRSPRKSISSINISSPLAKQLEIEVAQHTVSDDEIMVTTNPEIAVHVLPDDSSDWNSDFSSPSSWRRSSDRPVSRRLPYRLDVGGRLKDRAIDRGVLEAQHRILQQEKYLMQISNLSSALARLRPPILRCLVFELPDRGIQVGTSAFASAVREPAGSIEPSIEEERLWELWRQAEALLTIMDNDNIPLGSVENRLTLSKKRAIMLAFSDWEQYSLYVQDAWDKARRGIDQPDTEHGGRPSVSTDGAYDEFPSSPLSPGMNQPTTPRTSYDGCSIVSGLSPTSPRALMKFSLSRQRKSRRRSVVGVAPASLQRIADEASAIKDECEQLLMLMSPLYRESQLSPRNTMTSFSPASAAAANFLASGAQTPNMESLPPAPTVYTGAVSTPAPTPALAPASIRHNTEDSVIRSSPSVSIATSTPCPPNPLSSESCTKC
ncbi:hypothetical protein GGI15_003636 [Coemansia interrupta]|uniref:Uncharacterized protein n=1 Tax=Coemansia interrupta TaxID=1126814 RepID=A0A9W8H7D3_9FUNG|nr:hypothetical protein GGI15_003636 [Coemansia interrupta]